MKPKVYLDTSVISAYYDIRDLSRQKLTQEFWPKLKDFIVHISTLVLEELEDVKEKELRQKFLKLIEGFKILKIGPKEKYLAEEYIKEGIIPKRYKEDAYHTAVVTTNNLDYFISWNFEHLVKVRTRWLINLTNVKNGYKSIEIIAPPEL